MSSNSIKCRNFQLGELDSNGVRRRSGGWGMRALKLLDLDGAIEDASFHVGDLVMQLLMVIYIKREKYVTYY